MDNSYYIAEIFLPNKSAYSTHVIKMCNELSERSLSSNLILYHSDKRITYKKLKKDYLLTSKNNFLIKSIFKKKININFIQRIIFGFKVAMHLKDKKKSFILTRSLISSFFLSLFHIYHYVEIHNELSGLTKFLLIDLNFINSKYVKKVIFISTNLSKRFKVNKKLILHDAVDIKNFKKNKIPNKIKNIGYLGSFYEGRGIDIIIELAIKNKKLNFYLVGKDKNFKLTKKLPLNIKILNHVPYSKVPNLLSKFDILLMPYQKIVRVNSNNLNTAMYCSPLKMFDYLASGKIIISSKLSGINEILKNNYNSLLVKSDDLKQWNNSIKYILRNKSLAKKLRSNAFNTAINNTWKKRLEKIIKHNDK